MLNTKPTFAAPRAALDKKPPHGQPCTSCGLCCMATLCDLAQAVFGRRPLPGPCPALSWDKTGSRCGLVDSPAMFAPDRAARAGEAALQKSARHLIGAGLGCDARFNGEPPDLNFYANLARHDVNTAGLNRVAKKAWGVP